MRQFLAHKKDHNRSRKEAASVPKKRVPVFYAGEAYNVTSSILTSCFLSALRSFKESELGKLDAQLQQLSLGSARVLASVLADGWIEN